MFDFEESREEYNDWFEAIETLSVPATFNTIFAALTAEEIDPKRKVKAKPKPEDEEKDDSLWNRK